MSEQSKQPSIKTKLTFLAIVILAIVLLMTSCSKSEHEHPSGEKEEDIIESIKYEVHKDKGEPYTYVDIFKYEIDDIEYHLYEDGDGIFVINHTKEVLEVEKLKKEIRVD